MHLLIPFASTPSDAAGPVLNALELPALSGLLAHLALTRRDPGEPDSLSPPHERALAAEWGWQGADGCLPFAAQSALSDGVETGALAWGCLTPTHWQVGRDSVHLLDPQALQLDAAQSHEAFEAVRDLFESEGWQVQWGSPLRWYAAHDSLDGLACASLDRVVNRPVEHWMRPAAHQRDRAERVRRLQSELQLLLYPHPLNEAREARGQLPINSVWLSGCGRLQPRAGLPVTVDASLREASLAGDWAAWSGAWRQLDAGPVAQCLARARAGHAVSLTLCGESHAHRYDSVSPSAWSRLARRWQRPSPLAELQALS